MSVAILCKCFVCDREKNTIKDSGNISRWMYIIVMSAVVIATICYLRTGVRVPPSSPANSISQPTPVPDPSGEPEGYDPFTTLRADLARLQRVPALTQVSHNLLPKLDEYIRFSEEQLLRQDNSNISVSFIWNEHPTEDSDSRELARVAPSQNGVYQVLWSNNYDLVGVEARYSDRFTTAQFRTTLREEAIQSHRDLRLQFSEEAYQFILNRFLTEMGVFRFLEEVPSQPAFGIEFYDLHQMHSTVLCYLTQVNPQDPYWHRLNRTLTDCRSIMALARSMYCARLHGVTNVGVPYGSAHQPTLDGLKQSLNISGADMFAPGTPQSPR